MNTSDLKCRIVHLSDLHFGSSSFNCIEWRMICNKLFQLVPPPDIIIISGDIIDSARQISYLKSARDELDNIVKNIQDVEIIVIPGNHDVGFMGNIKLPRSLYLFKTFFEKYYPEAKRIIKILREKEILIIPFNSNNKMRLATGEINPKEIYQMDLFLESLKSSRNIVTALRIAVLHHHPLPIPYTKRKSTNLEPFLTLRNAGTLLMELSKSGHEFDLILHGHRHYPNFARIKLRKKSAEIGVLAAGSACLNNPEYGKNSFNIINFTTNGRAYIEQYEYGGGYSIELVNKESLFDVEGFKWRLHKRNLQRQRFKFSKVEHTINIKSFGNAEIKSEFKNLKLEADTSKSGRPFEIVLDKGRIIDIRLPEELKKSGFQIETLERSLKSFRGWINFGQTITSAKPQVSYSIEYRAHSAFAMTKDELFRISGEKEKTNESYSFTVCCPIDKLSIKIIFEDKGLLENLFPHLKVLILKDMQYPPLDDQYELDLDSLSEFELDYELTNFESQNLKFTPDGLLLELVNPLVGSKYVLTWELPKEERLSKFGYYNIIGEIEAYQRQLVKHRNRILDKEKNDKDRDIRDLIGQITRDLYNEFKSFEDETFSMTLMSYDAREKKLVIIDGGKIQVIDNNIVDSDLSWDFKIEPGVGNAGLSYKRGRRISFRAYSDSLESKFLTSKSDTPYVIMISFPIYHRKVNLEELPARTIQLPVIAIISLSSTSSASGLNKLLFDTADSKELYNYYWNFFQLAGNTVLEILNLSDNQ